MKNRVEIVSKKEYCTKDLIAACEAVNRSMLDALPNLLPAAVVSDVFPASVKRHHIRFVRTQRAHRIGRSVAAVVLALFVSLSAILTVNASARDAFVRWWKEVWEDRIVYFFETESVKPQKVRYALGWVPERFELVNEDESDTSAYYVYESETGESFVFYYEQTDPINFTEYVPLGDYSHETVQILDKTADLYSDKSIDGNLTVIWVDDEKHYVFCLDAIMERDTLLKIAESVITK